MLRKVAQPVDPEEIASTHIKKLLAHMREALEEQKDGVALAAPQIGESVRIFIVSPSIFEPATERNADEEEQVQKKHVQHHLVFINPVIVKRSKKKLWMEEGCLSVRWLYGHVERAARATVSAIDEHGRPFTRGAGGLLAQIFQHEIDHLDGILFIDKAKNIQDLKKDNN